jgi:hypothetical protein
MGRIERRVNTAGGASTSVALVLGNSEKTLSFKKKRSGIYLMFHAIFKPQRYRRVHVEKGTE